TRTDRQRVLLVDRRRLRFPSQAHLLVLIALVGSRRDRPVVRRRHAVGTSSGLPYTPHLLADAVVDDERRGVQGVQPFPHRLHVGVADGLALPARGLEDERAADAVVPAL